MRITVTTYVPGASPVHACDARVKVLLLLAYSITLFLVGTWTGLALAALAFGAVLALSGVGFARVARLSFPVYVLVAFAVLFNSFSLDAFSLGQQNAQGLFSGVSAGIFEGAEPVRVWGSLAFVPAGFARGCFYALRIVFLVYASLVVSFTTASTELVAAFSSFMGPLRRFKAPVDDIATVLSIALRFIPVTAGELALIRDAQWARGAGFSQGGIVARLKAWQTVFVPLFVALFRRADRLACAMDARCYGAPGAHRTSLAGRKFRAADMAALLLGCAFCVTLAIAS